MSARDAVVVFRRDQQQAVGADDLAFERLHGGGNAALLLHITVVQRHAVQRDHLDLHAFGRDLLRGARQGGVEGTCAQAARQCKDAGHAVRKRKKRVGERPKRAF
jgi:hypothetical protein